MKTKILMLSAFLLLAVWVSSCKEKETELCPLQEAFLGKWELIDFMLITGPFDPPYPPRGDYFECFRNGKLFGDIPGLSWQTRHTYSVDSIRFRIDHNWWANYSFNENKDTLILTEVQSPNYANYADYVYVYLRK